MKKLLITSLFLVFLSASALGQPTGPHVLDGEVSLNNETVTGTVEARHGGQVLSSVEAEDGEFTDLAVQNVEAGTVVDVYISGVEADQNITYEPWKVEEENFSASFGKEENVTVRNVKKDVSKDEGLDIEVPDQVSKDDSGVDELNISVNEDASDVEVNITVSDEMNDKVDKEEVHDIEDSGSTFLGFIDVDTNILEEARGSASIGFKVNKSKVSEPREVVLIHYENEERVDVLESTFREKKTQDRDDNFYYLKADTTSFSSFAITSDTTDPEADAGEDITVEVGEEAEFNASGSSDNVEIKNYSWEFQDETLEGKIVENSFSTVETFDVELTVYDTSGNSDTDTVNVVVESSEVTPTDPPEDDGTEDETEETDDTEEETSETSSEDTSTQETDENETQSEQFTEPSIAVESINATPESGTPPFQVDLNVEVENNGNATGTENITVELENETIGHKDVELEAEAWTALSFEYTVEDEGVKEFTSGGLSTTVESESKSRIPYLLMLLLVASIVAAYYFREELKEYVAEFRDEENKQSEISHKPPEFQ